MHGTDADLVHLVALDRLEGGRRSARGSLRAAPRRQMVGWMAPHREQSRVAERRDAALLRDLAFEPRCDWPLGRERRKRSSTPRAHSPRAGLSASSSTASRRMCCRPSGTAKVGDEAAAGSHDFQHRVPERFGREVRKMSRAVPPIGYASRGGRSWLGTRRERSPRRRRGGGARGRAGTSRTGPGPRRATAVPRGVRRARGGARYRARHRSSTRGCERRAARTPRRWPRTPAGLPRRGSWRRWRERSRTGSRRCRRVESRPAPADRRAAGPPRMGAREQGPVGSSRALPVTSTRLETVRNANVLASPLLIR